MLLRRPCFRIWMVWLDPLRTNSNFIGHTIRERRAPREVKHEPRPCFTIAPTERAVIHSGYIIRGYSRLNRRNAATRRNRRRLRRSSSTRKGYRSGITSFAFRGFIRRHGGYDRWRDPRQAHE